jgi:hypothetical protein
LSCTNKSSLTFSLCSALPFFPPVPLFVLPSPSYPPPTYLPPVLPSLPFLDPCPLPSPVLCLCPLFSAPPFTHHPSCPSSCP